MRPAIFLMDAGDLLCFGTVFLNIFPVHAIAPVRIYIVTDSAVVQMEVTRTGQQNHSFHVGPVFFAFAADN